MVDLTNESDKREVGVPALEQVYGKSVARAAKRQRNARLGMTSWLGKLCNSYCHTADICIPVVLRVVHRIAEYAKQPVWCESSDSGHCTAA